MGKVSQGTANVNVDVNVTVTYDETTGLPVSATGQKELVEASGDAGEEPVKDLTITEATASKFEAAYTAASSAKQSAVQAAEAAYESAVQAAKDELEKDLVADNFSDAAPAA